MPKFIFAYHGGGRPETPEEGQKEMAAWMAWYEKLGPSIVDGGAPVGMSQTVTSGGVEGNGGSNPLSGYTVVSAADIDEATTLAKGCPIFAKDGSVEVAPIIEM